jgi:hypothetical protein
MNFSKPKKQHNGNVTHDTEDFRKRALVIAFIMAITGLFFLGATLYFTGRLEIIF